MIKTASWIWPFFLITQVWILWVSSPSPAYADTASANVKIVRAPSGSDVASSSIKTVEQVDLKKYMGKWYEVARLPNFFQKGCTDVVVEYTLKDDGNIDILNQCKTEGSKVKTQSAFGWVEDKKTNSKLKVRFFWPFSADYWIMDLGSNYEYAVVGQPSRAHLWILSRTPTIEKSTYSQILNRISQQGYTVQDLELTVHHDTSSEKAGAKQ